MDPGGTLEPVRCALAAGAMAGPARATGLPPPGALRLQRECVAGRPARFRVAGAGQPLAQGPGGAVAWDDVRLERPDLVHVVHDEMIEAALTLTESARLPYIQTIADFRTIEKGLRLSRRVVSPRGRHRPGSRG